MKIGSQIFDLDKTYVMGILNVTPDSFSDGGRYLTRDAVLYRAEQMIAEGAAILDVGGESTRPGYTKISDEEEISRTVPVVELLKSRFDTPVSVDTYKSGVARAVLEAGADLINDIWGLKYDDKIANVINEYHVPVVLMHNREQAEYTSFLEDVLSDLQESVRIAQAAHIKAEQIILDPGVGFAKSYEQNLSIIKNMSYFKKLGYPMLLGTSRKSVIGLTLDLKAEERLEGTLVTSILAAQAGYSFVRVHDIKENVRALKMLSRIAEA